MGSGTFVEKGKKIFWCTGFSPELPFCLSSASNIFLKNNNLKYRIVLVLGKYIKRNVLNEWLHVRPFLNDSITGPQIKTSFTSAFDLQQCPVQFLSQFTKRTQRWRPSPVAMPYYSVYRQSAPENRQAILLSCTYSPEFISFNFYLSLQFI